MTPVVIAKLEEAFSNGASKRMACFIAGISEDALENYIKKNPDYNLRLIALQDMPAYEAQQSVRRFQKTNGELALKHLERVYKDKYSLRHELAGVNGNSIEITIKEE